ncbi:MAG: YesL family protein [Faecousia sp.]
MSGLFSPDSKFMQCMSRLCDLIILNLLFLLTCLPIITVGAASTALYTVCFRMGTEREEGLLRTYFRAFRDNFRQGTALWGILALFLAASGVNLILCLNWNGLWHYAMYLFGLLLVLAVFLFSYTFPLLSQFGNSVRSTLKNALLLSIGYLPRSLAMAVINCLPLGLLLADPYTFLQTAFLWVFLYFAGAAYINTRLLNKVFAPYLTPDTAETEEV